MSVMRRSLTDRLQELADQHPGRPALVEFADAGDLTVTYGELWLGLVEAGRALGAACGRLGGDAVFCHPARTGIASAKVLLGALCAGVTVFPYPPDLSSEALAETLRRSGLEACEQAGTAAGPGGGPAGVVARWVERRYVDQPTFVLATSGSTGSPKLMPFWEFSEYDPRAVPDVVFRTCHWQDSGGVHLTTLPLHHIAPFSVLVQGVLDGRTTLLAHGPAPSTVVDAVRRHRAGWWLVTPDHMRSLLPAASSRPSALSSIRTLLHTAELCEPELKRAWLELLGSERVSEMYGATEGVGVTVIHGREWLARPGSVGRGVLTRIKVLDDAGVEVAPGQVGSIHLKRLGGGAATGHRAMSLGAGTDGYVTLGDLGYVDEDGFLYMVDRALNRVESPNGPIWLRSVAASLRTHPAVAEAVCVDGGHERGIVAVVVPSGEAELGDAELAEHCARQLAPHERPQHFVAAEEIPRTALGKTNWPALMVLIHERLPAADDRTLCEHPHGQATQPLDCGSGTARSDCSGA